MSNFGSLELVTGGLPGTAPQIFSASTPDNLGTITATGYLNDQQHRVKLNDVFYINYSDTSVFPLNTGEASTIGEFIVTYSAGNWGLTTALSGLGQAAAKNVTDNTKSYVASVDGAPASYTVGNILLAGDTNGSIGLDSGFGLSNLLQHARVAMTAAQWNAMYATPFLLVAAPGANKMIVVEQITLGMTFVSAAYAAGGVVGAQYGSTAHGAGATASSTEAAADFFAAASTMFRLGSGLGTGAPFSTAANAGLYLSNLTGAFTTGDGTWIVDIFYRVVATV